MGAKGVLTFLVLSLVLLASASAAIAIGIDNDSEFIFDGAQKFTEKLRKITFFANLREYFTENVSIGDKNFALFIFAFIVTIISLYFVCT